MKSFCFATLIASLSLNLLGQSYYPLKPSNRWFFDSTASPLRVLADSSFSNGHTYSLLSKADFAGGSFVRADSHFVYYFDPQSVSELPFFHLDGLIGDTTYVNRSGFSTVSLIKIDTQTILNASTRVLTFRLDGTILRQVMLSEKFGPICAWYYGDPPPPWPDFVATLTGCVIDGITYGTVASVPLHTELPESYQLRQNFPNPFNPGTNILYEISERTFIRIVIINTLGQTVRTLIQANTSPGVYSIRWNGTDALGNAVSSGIYFSVMYAGNKSVAARKMVLLK